MTTTYHFSYAPHPPFDSISKLVLLTADGTNGTSSSVRNRGARVRSKLYTVRISQTIERYRLREIRL